MNRKSGVRYRPAPPDQKFKSIDSSRSQRRDVNPSEPQITSNDIVILKKELNNLTQQKSLLKAKIQRLNDTLKNHRPKPANQQMANSLEKEMKKIEQYNANRRAEIAAIMSSDLAAEISEQQQESILLYEEINRINKRRKEAEKELADVTEQLEIASQQYSEENLQIAQHKISMLEQEIANQEQRNERLRSQIEEAEAEMSKAEIESNENLSKQVEKLEQQIQKEKDEIASLDQEIEDTKTKNEEEIKELEQKLKSMNATYQVAPMSSKKKTEGK